MRVIVSFVDSFVVVDGEPRFVEFNFMEQEGVRGLSWDGEIGYRWYDALENAEPDRFEDETIIEPFIVLWEQFEPEPPPPEVVFVPIPAEHQVTEPDPFGPEVPDPIEELFSEAPEMVTDTSGLPLSSDPPPPEYEFEVYVAPPLPEYPPPPEDGA